MSIDFKTAKNIRVPTLLLAGGKDSLAQAQEIQKSTQYYHPSSQWRLITIPKFAHIDFIMQKATQKLGPVFTSFMKNPEHFGPAYKSYVIHI